MLILVSLDFQPINRHLSPDYDAFCDSFSLTARASDIAAALQNEDDVSKFYEDLVPNSLDSEEFWKRYDSETNLHALGKTCIIGIFIRFLK